MPLLQIRMHLNDDELDGANRMAVDKGCGFDTVCAVYGSLGIREWMEKNPAPSTASPANGVEHFAETLPEVGGGR